MGFGHEVSFLVIKELNNPDCYSYNERGKTLIIKEEDTGRLYAYLRRMETKKDQNKSLMRFIQNIKLLKRMSSTKRYNYVDQVIQPIAVRKELLDMIQTGTHFSEKIFYDKECDESTYEDSDDDEEERERGLIDSLCDQARSLLVSTTITEHEVEVEVEAEEEQEQEAEVEAEIDVAMTDTTQFELNPSYRLIDYLSPEDSSTVKIRRDLEKTYIAIGDKYSAHKFLKVNKKIYFSAMHYF